MVTEDGKWSRSHGLTSEILQIQAKAMAIPLVQQRTSTANYEADFKKVIRNLKQEGISGGVFGDIDFNEHITWVERVCQESGITSHLPLYGLSQDRIMKDFINAGFEAIVVAAKAEFFGEEVLGMKIDSNFIKFLEPMVEGRVVTPCGEAGEYHTFVVDGPLFQKRVEVLKSQKTERDGHRFLEILKADLRDKR